MATNRKSRHNDKHELTFRCCTNECLLNENPLILGSPHARQVLTSKTRIISLSLRLLFAVIMIQSCAVYYSHLIRWPRAMKVAEFLHLFRFVQKASVTGVSYRGPNLAVDGNDIDKDLDLQLMNDSPNLAISLHLQFLSTAALPSTRVCYLEQKFLRCQDCLLHIPFPTSPFVRKSD